MLQKITNVQRSTVNEIREEYPDSWFRYGRKKDNSIHLVYIADTLDELLTVPEKEMKSDGFVDWGEVYPKRLMRNNLEIGGITSVWSD